MAAVSLLLLATGCATRHHQRHLEGQYTRDWQGCSTNSDLGLWYRAPFLVDCVLVAEVVGSDDDSAAVRDYLDQAGIGHYTHFHPRLGLMVEKRPDLFLGEGVDRTFLGWLTFRVTNREAFERAFGPIQTIPEMVAAMGALADSKSPLVQAVSLLAESRYEVADPAPFRKWAEAVRDGLPQAQAALENPDPMRSLEALSELSWDAALARAFRRYLGDELATALVAVVTPRRLEVSGDPQEDVAIGLQRGPLSGYRLEDVLREREATREWKGLSVDGLVALVGRELPGWPCEDAAAATSKKLPPAVLRRVAQDLKQAGGPEVDAARQKSERCVALAAREAAAREAEQKAAEAARLARRAGAQDALFAAARKGSLDQAKQALADGADANAVGARGTNFVGDTPLQVAANAGNVEVARALLDAGADLEAAHAWSKRTALLTAASNDRVEVVKLLLDRGARVDRVDRSGGTALLSTKSDAITRLLLAAKADVNAKDELHRTALMKAAQDGRLEALRMLLEAGADVNAQETPGQGAHSALMQAALWNQTAAVERLLAARARVDARTTTGHTALLLCAGQGYARIAEVLLRAGADVNAKNDAGQTALMLASREGHLGVVKLLRAANATGPMLAPRQQPTPTRPQVVAPKPPEGPRGTCVSLDLQTRQLSCRETTAAACSGNFTAKAACTFTTADANAKHDPWAEGLDQYLKENPTKVPTKLERCRKQCMQVRCTRHRNPVTANWTDGGRCAGFCVQQCENDPDAYR